MISARFRRRFLLAGVAIAALVNFRLVASAESDVDSQAIDLNNAGKVTCPKDQVSTERGCVTPPRPIKRVAPRYPESARQHGTRGQVTLKVVVQADGKVGKVEVVSCTQPGEGF